MKATNTHQKIVPQLGEGVFLTRDAAEILKLPYATIRHWLFDFWDGRFSKGYSYSFGEKGSKAINFYTLIEFYTFYHLRRKGFSSQKIQTFHTRISKELNTPYPFAGNLRTDGKSIWYEYLGELIKADGKAQFDWKSILEGFLEKIDFGHNSLATRYYPLDRSKNVVVDPRHQFGQPTIIGTNIQTKAIFNLYTAGETEEDISVLYDLNVGQVKDALLYYKRTA